MRKTHEANRMRYFDTDYSNATYAKNIGDHTVMIRDQNIITVWWGENAYQDIIWSEEAATAIINGADPVEDGWEDGAGNVVCIDNAMEVE